MIINKITTGFVIQKYSTDLQTWISQDFVAGDQCDYEDEDGNAVSVTSSDTADPDIAKFFDNEPYLPFDMVQPD